MDTFSEILKKSLEGTLACHQGPADVRDVALAQFDVFEKDICNARLFLASGSVTGL